MTHPRLPQRKASRFLWLPAALALTLPACRVTDLILWHTAPSAPGDSFEVEEVRNVAYYSGPDATSRHELDLYLPRGLKEFPVVVLVHGGTWMAGDNRCCGLYSSVGRLLASRGIGTVMPNYRLTPSVRHPEHVKDIARAVAWTHAHIAEHGGRLDQLFLAGHSAGGHLVSLLATDEQYLKAEGLCIADIKGVMAISGVYHLPPGKVDVALGGSAPDSLRMNSFLPLRGLTTEGPDQTGSPGLPVRLNVFGMAFGNDPKVREAASPVTHVRPGLPPFVLVYGENDLPLLGEMAEEFQSALVSQGCDARVHKIPRRNHHSIIFRAVDSRDEVARIMLDFIAEHTPKDHVADGAPVTLPTRR